MPITQRTGLSLDFFDAFRCGRAVVDFLTQQDEGVSAGCFAQQSGGSGSGGGVSGAWCEQPQPLALHCSAVPQPQTSWPQGLAVCPGVCGTGNPMAATTYAKSVTPLKRRRRNVRHNGSRRLKAMPPVVLTAGATGQEFPVENRASPARIHCPSRSGNLDRHLHRQRRLDDGHRGPCRLATMSRKRGQLHSQIQKLDDPIKVRPKMRELEMRNTRRLRIS
jgi:hypothetical protein